MVRWAGRDQQLGNEDDTDDATYNDMDDDDDHH
jgi:hypothetical protein